MAGLSLSGMVIRIKLGTRIITSQLSGTKNSLLGFASLHILANNYQPIIRALDFYQNMEFYSNYGRIPYGQSVVSIFCHLFIMKFVYVYRLAACNTITLIRLDAKETRALFRSLKQQAHLKLQS